MTPYEEGLRDRRNGATIWQNPNAAFTLKFVQWENGWLDQDRRLHEREMEQGR